MAYGNEYTAVHAGYTIYCSPCPIVRTVDVVPVCTSRLGRPARPNATRWQCRGATETRRLASSSPSDSLCTNIIPFQPTSNELHVCHSRCPVRANLPTNGFAVIPLSLRLDEMKRELERVSGAGSVDVDFLRVKQQKETTQAAMPATTPKSNNVASDPSAIEPKQDLSSLWSTVKDAANKKYGLLFSHLSNRPHTRSVVVGVVCSL